MPSGSRDWVRRAVSAIEADRQRSADTHLLRLELPELDGVDVYLKDETVHPTGSLKHRLARSLFLHALCSGALREGMTVVEASSGSTAISEAYFARLIGAPFLAVVPASTAEAKVRAIHAAGGRTHLTGPGEDTVEVAARLARELNGCFLDQFVNAERATDWRGNNNIAESLFEQMARERHPVPRWVVVGAGTGGTGATIGRYVRYRPDLAATRLCVVDPAGSAFFESYVTGDPTARGRCSDVVEGIGRPRVEPSFVVELVDRMVEVSDCAAVAAARWLERRTGRRFGPSTGANLIGVLVLAGEMRAAGEAGSVVTLGCDGGERYAATVYDDGWVRDRCPGLDAWTGRFARFEAGEGFDASGLRVA